MKQSHNHSDLLNIFYHALHKNDVEQANLCIQHLKELEPEAPEVLSMKGQLFRHTGRIEDGDALIVKAIDAKSKEITRDHPNIEDLNRIPLFSSVVFLGGNWDIFFQVGIMQLELLQSQGLDKDDYVLDIGSGCFRGGLWVCKYLSSNRYYAIEPNKVMVYFGLRHVLQKDLCKKKKPTIHHNTDFTFSAFQKKFDYVIARSIWTHASKGQIMIMLEEFIHCSSPKGMFLASYIPTNGREEYEGEEWIGRSHTSEIGGYVYYSFSWIQTICQQYNLHVEELSDFIIGEQIWLKITHIQKEVS